MAYPKYSRARQRGKMYRRSDKLRFSEMDADGKMRLSSLMDALQDCSDAQSEALGIGYSWLRAREQGWILPLWHVVIDRYPEDREEYIVETRPWKFEHFLDTGTFAIYDKEGTAIVKANSDGASWIRKGCARSKPDSESNPYGVDPRLDMEYPEGTNGSATAGDADAGAVRCHQRSSGSE